MILNLTRAMLFGATAVICLAAPQSADVAPPQKRASVVDLAKALLQPPGTSALEVPLDAKNPFDPSKAPVEKANKPNRPESDYDLLVLLAAELQPSGMFVMGDAPILLLGQKKAKVGDRVSITFDGVAYDVEIIAIERNNFSLRFNKAEFTRAIKTGKTP